MSSFVDTVGRLYNDLTRELAYSKKLKCDFCKCSVSITEAKFPEDLFDLIQKYQIDHLIWVCSDCKSWKERSMINCLKLTDQFNSLTTSYDRQMNPKIINLDRSNFFPAASSPSSTTLSRASSISSDGPSSSLMSVQSSRNESVSSLKDILINKVKIGINDWKQNKEILEKFVKMFLDKLRASNSLFKALYSKTYYTGSSYEGLRITDANEFDIDLVLKFLFKEKDFQVEYEKDVPSFAMYKLQNDWLSSNPNNQEQYAEIKKHLVDEENYLMPCKVLQWMQSIISKVNLSSSWGIDNVVDICLSESGPAKTVKIKTSYNQEISIDLVPVIEFAPPNWPKYANTSVLKTFDVNKTDYVWFLVPKQYIPINGNKTNLSASSKRFWRIHFPEFEKIVLHNKGCVKPVIKLMKLLRDKEKWNALCSYFLKTVAMWVVIENPKPEYWREDLMHERLLEVLGRLQKCLDEKKIPHIFYPEYNLLQKVQPEHAKNMSCRLKRLLASNLSLFKKWGMEKL